MKCVFQHDTMECGAACLTMVCNIFGSSIPLKKISEKCHATTEGISIHGISTVAKELGLYNETAKLKVEDLPNCPLPAILHWNQNHFVVLYRINRKASQFYIADPGKGLLKLNKNEFAQHWIGNSENTGNEKGIGMFFRVTDKFDFIKDMYKQKISLTFLLSHLTGYWKSIAQIILGLILGCIFQLIMPFLTQSIVDIGIKNKNISFIWLILFGEMIIVIARVLTDIIRRWLLLFVSMRINITLVSDFFIKLLKLPMSFFDTKVMGDLLQRIGDHSRVQGFLTSQILNIIFCILSFIIFGIILAIYNQTIFLIYIGASIIYGIWLSGFLHKRKLIDYELFEKEAQNRSITYQFLTSMQEIKLQGCEKRRRWEWEDVQADLFKTQMNSLKLKQTQETGTILINETRNIIITVISATAVINNDISLGAMLAIQYVIGQLNSPVEQLMSFIYALQDVRISIERINEIQNQRDEDQESSILQEFSSPKSILIKNIYFKYDYFNPSYIINNITFNIPAGKVTAIVGESGSGKTTLLKLILGYYNLNNGKILIAGSELNHYNLKWWRNRCGVVMQDGIIFSESIARNIANTDDDIDFDRLNQSAKTACIYDYIMGLPLQYNTRIGLDGIGLSQGQKQRILLARAIYKNPDFIFLDEATNALDSITERCIVNNLNEFCNGRTVIIIAHRLSTVKKAHNIIVLEHGKVSETGTHDALIKKHGAYYNLIHNQLEIGE